MIGFTELGDVESCEAEYKNSTEVAASLQLNKASLIDLHQRLLRSFPALEPTSMSAPGTNVIAVQTSEAPDKRFSTILIRMVFLSQAQNVDFFVQAYFNG